MKRAILVGIICLCLLFSCSEPVSSQETSDTLDRYLNKNAKLGIGLSPIMPIGEEAALSGDLLISPRMAAAFAVHHLRQMGVEDIVICESRWIPGAVSGYLVDALGSLTVAGKHFSVLRIGIRDGGEEKHGREYRAGTHFVFIALGWDSAGRPIWYPPPGPDYRTPKDEVTQEGALSYEFLLRRKEFESLPARYGPRKADRNSRKLD